MDDNQEKETTSKRTTYMLGNTKITFVEDCVNRSPEWIESQLKKISQLIMDNRTNKGTA